MRTIMLAFHNAVFASKVKNILIGSGLPVNHVSSSGAGLLQHAMLFNEGGVIIVPARLSDMNVPDLYSRLPDTYDILVLQEGTRTVDFGYLPGVTVLTLPFAGALLVETVTNLLEYRMAAAGSRNYGEKRHAGQAPAHGRSSQDEKIIADAKLCLIRKNHLTEEQAHRHLQQLSMETGRRIVDIARQVIRQETR